MATMHDKNPQATINWKLNDWFRAAGVKNDVEFADVAAEIGILNGNQPWNPKRIGEIKNRASGITNQAAAFQWIAILKFIAEQNGIVLFSGQGIESDIHTFMHSKACKDNYAMPSNKQLRDIFRHSTRDEDEAGESPIYGLRSRVLPPPPRNLIGRDKDVIRVVESLKKNAVTAIDGIAGDGKTALAWVCAIHGYQNRLYTNFDWVTDKRHMLNFKGERIPTFIPEDDISFFDNMLISFCRQFGWQDLLGARDEHLINKCADRLRAGRYLLVVDNIESLADSENIIYQLTDMLMPLSPLEPISSRALITSREQIMHPNVSRVSIMGVEVSDRVALIDYYQELWQIQPRLSPERVTSIAEISGGNPLFIQLMLQLYRLLGRAQEVDTLFEDLAQSEHNFLVLIIETILEKLSLLNQRFAEAIALELAIAHEATTEDNLRYVWASIIEGEHDEKQFMNVLQELVTHRIINWSRGHHSTYTMHPLIQSYFLSK